MKKGILFFVLMMLAMSNVFAATSTYRASEGVDIEVTLLNQDPDPVAPGSWLDLRFKVENFGNKAFQDMYLKINPTNVLIPEVDEVAVGNIQRNQVGNEGIVVKMRVQVAASALEGTLPFVLAYKEGASGSWLEVDDYSISIESSAKVLSIDNYQTTPESLKSGSKGTIDVELFNLADAGIKDVKIKLTTDTNILPVDNTNEKVLKSIPRGLKESVSFNVIVSSTASSGVYALPIVITYKDFQDNEYTVSNTLSVLVDNKPELLVNLESSEITCNKKKGFVEISISNSGVSDIKFVSYRLKESNDYKILSTPFKYIGNIDSDDFETVDTELYVDKCGDEAKLQVELSYKDSFNKDYQVVKELPVKVYSQEEMVMYGYAPAENKIAGLFPLFIIGTLVFVFWIFMFIDLRKTKMQKYRKVLWYILFFLTGPLGALGYMFFGRGRGED